MKKIKDVSKPMTVHEMRVFLDKFEYSEPVSFLIDEKDRAIVWEMYGDKSPVITLRTIVAQDHIEPWYLDSDNAS